MQLPFADDRDHFPAAIETPMPPLTPTSTERRGSFPTTHWSVVLSAGRRDLPQAQSALESLCQQYWFPLYAYIRRRGKSHHEAEDLTQDFLAKLLERGSIGLAQPERGRFRTFLLTSLQNFLTNAWHHEHTAKRGGGIPALSLGLADAENQFSREPTDPGMTPEQAYDRSWALALIDRALEDLKAEYVGSGRGELFTAVAPVIWGGGSPERLRVHAARLGMNEGALKVAIHRLRKRLRERLELLVLETLENPGDASEELRHLLASIH